jgi:hypothetical protein
MRIWDLQKEIAPNVKTKNALYKDRHRAGVMLRKKVLTMRERLIQLIKHDNCINPYNCSDKCKYVELDDCHSARLADYLIDNGVVVLPCPIDTHIYVVPTQENGLTEITEMVVRGFAIGRPRNVANCFRTRGTSALFQPSFEQFGKTVFLTREEAERALKGGAE